MNIQVLNLKKINDPIRGNLTVVENGREIPFEVKRAYWTYDVPSGECRGGHAHKELKQMIVALGGCFTLSLDDGKEKREITLKHPFQAVIINPGIWRELHDFSAGAVCMVLASDIYDEDDYIRDYNEFLEYTKSKG